jgi:hypothetical protein
VTVWVVEFQEENDSKYVWEHYIVKVFWHEDEAIEWIEAQRDPEMYSYMGYELGGETPFDVS